MTNTEIMYFLAPFVSFALIALGLQYKNKIFGFLGGLLLFLNGTVIAITPLPVLSSLFNDVLSTILWGLGLYVMYEAMLENINLNM